ncbi:hypothetical protein CMK22_10730 [Candidatus Poribacteria bacterium]|nr:hypothetical protein [Candidatus Poribacteria bacterium]
MWKFSWMLFVLVVVFVGCGEEIADDEDKSIKDLVEDEALVEDKAIKDLVEDEALVEDEKKITWEKDGSKMVLIPSGSFQMGDHLDKMSNALPVHKVELDDFYMDSHQITVGQFKRFLKESGYKPEAVKGGWEINRFWNEVKKYSPTDKHPVIYVSWNDATAYTKWAGKRLPTEAEWEYAGRGGQVGKRYPWGDDEKVARDYANYKRTDGKDKWDKLAAPVGSFKPNGYSLYDMAGNVWEWCSDWYDKDYYSKSPLRNPQGPSSGSTRVLRGGHWTSGTLTLRVAYRLSNTPNRRLNPNSGFRCVSGFPVAQQ